VKSGLTRVLSSSEMVESELATKDTSALPDLASQLKDRSKQLLKLDEADARLAAKWAKGDMADNVFDMASAGMRAERAWLHEETERLQVSINSLRDHEAMVEQVKELANRIGFYLETATFEEWREVLAGLGARLVVTTDRKLVLTVQPGSLPEMSNDCVRDVSMSR
jgi:hypothetical protein